MSVVGVRGALRATHREVESQGTQLRSAVDSSVNVHYTLSSGTAAGFWIA